VISELNKIFERNFIVGYFLPALAFLAASIALMNAYGVLPPWLRIDRNDPLKDTTFVALVVWVAALALMVLNRMILRCMEGYWIFDFGIYFQFDLGQALAWYRRKVWGRLQARLQSLKAQQPTKAAEYERVYIKASNSYPSKQEYMLITQFGNTLRAFEDYPRVMYKFESITGWSRLLTVVPKDFREVIDGARADVDFWMNLWFLGYLFVAEYAALWAWSGTLLFPKFVVPAVIVAIWFASWQARVAAEQWGEWVKAAFDIYLPDLCKKLGYDLPPGRAEQQKFWLHLSQAFLYRHPDSLDAIERYRAEPPPSPPPAPPPP
jgi:hypothetical protein